MQTRFLLSISLAGLLALTGAAASAQTSTCPPPTGKDFSGQDLTDKNFSRQDLTGANFSRATLNGAQFVGAKLIGAVFANAQLGPSAKAPVNFTGADLTRACLQNTTLKQSNLQFATVTCTDFSGADLTNAVFASMPMIDASQTCRAKFVNARMKINQFPTALWAHTDFTNTNFIDLTPDSFSFNGLDISGAMLSGIKIAGFDLRQSTLNSVDLSKADLRGAHLDGATAYGINLSQAMMSFTTAQGAKFYNPATPDVKADLSSVVAQNADFSNQVDLSFAKLRSANFSGAKLSGANLSSAVLEAGEGLNATQLTGADLSNVTFSSAHLNSVSFQNTRLGGATFYNTTLLNTDLSNAIMPGVSFEQSTLQGVSFQESAMQNDKFKNATLSASPSTSASVNLSCAQLGGADFSTTTINAASFNAAVMPPYTECCSEVGGGYYCGTEPATQSPYGPAIAPVLKGPVTCPNGDNAICDATQWKIPNWQTNLCNRQGAQEQVWTPPDCQRPPPGDIVKVPDANFKECLRVQLFGPTSPPKDITKQFAAKVQEINCPARGIKDSTGLEAFTGLADLDLTANQLTDGAVYAHLPNLQVLKVANNQLPLIDLSGLNQLTYLDASNNRLTIVKGFVSTYLQYLDLSNNQLAGSFPLQIQNTLFFADLSHNSLTDVGKLSGFSSMAYLYLQNNNLQTIGSLKAIADSGTLQHLNLACNLGFDCNSLQLSSDPQVCKKYPNECTLLAASNCGVKLPTCNVQGERKKSMPKK